MNIGNITSDNFNLDGNGKDMQIEVYEQLIEQLQKENKILKENAENNDKVVDKVNWENQLLKKENEKQKEFIKYMNDIIEDLETEDVDDEEMKSYLIQRIDTFKEILQKYKSIIGENNE